MEIFRLCYPKTTQFGGGEIHTNPILLLADNGMKGSTFLPSPLLAGHFFWESTLLPIHYPLVYTPWQAWTIVYAFAFLMNLLYFKQALRIQNYFIPFTSLGSGAKVGEKVKNGSGTKVGEKVKN